MIEGRSPGRPRSEAARRAILEATRDLVLESGYEATTIEGVADRAGVSRQTIYRWWPTKSSMVAEAVIEGLVVLPSTPQPETGDAARDLRAWLSATVAIISEPRNAALVRGLAALSAIDPAESALLNEISGRPVHERLVGLVQSAIDAGALRSDVASDVIADALVGTVFYRVIARAEIPTDFPDDLLRLIGLRVEP